MLYERVPQLVDAEQLRTDFVAEVQFPDQESVFYEGEAGDFLIRDANTGHILGIMDEDSFYDMYQNCECDEDPCEECCDCCCSDPQPTCGDEEFGVHDGCYDDRCDPEGDDRRMEEVKKSESVPDYSKLVDLLKKIKENEERKKWTGLPINPNPPMWPNPVYPPTYPYMPSPNVPYWVNPGTFYVGTDPKFLCGGTICSGGSVIFNA